MKQGIKFATDFGPLLIFFFVNAKWGIFAATATFMVAILIALAVAISVERKVPKVPLGTALIVLVFGGLTLYLNDELFIKLKPTIVNGLFAAILFGGLFFGRALVKPVLGAVWAMDDHGWRRLTLRWAWFFVAMAILNEMVWRNFSTDVWVSFKVFGFLPITFLFSLTQVPLMQRHRLEDEGA